jgi:dTDP-glucose 4,6-dehydratase
MDKNYWQGRTVLVTGAGGFIGSHLVEWLVNEGAHVRAFVRYTSTGTPGLIRQLPADVSEQVDLIYGDLRDQAAVKGAMNGVQTVMHLGALISIPYSYRHPAEVVETNVIGTLNILLAGREAGVERIVHTSSSEVYGTARYVPMGENHPLQGQSPYSASKIGADMLVDSFFRSYDLPVVTVRPFNTYGPRQSSRAVIPTIIVQAMTQDEIRLGNLEAKRDLTYVTDTVAGFLKAGEKPGVEGQTFNLGVGREISVNMLVEIILEIIGRKVPVHVEQVRTRPSKSEVDRLLSDNSLAKARLDWAPQVDLRQGLSYTITWIQDHLNDYQVGNYHV